MLAASLPGIWGNVAAWGSVVVAVIAACIAWLSRTHARETVEVSRELADISRRSLALNDEGSEKRSSADHARSRLRPSRFATDTRLHLRRISPANESTREDADLRAEWIEGCSGILSGSVPRLNGLIFQLESQYQRRRTEGGNRFHREHGEDDRGRL